MSGGVSNSKLYLDIAGRIGAKRMLAKPFTPAELLAAIDEIVAPAGKAAGSNSTREAP
jgi:DNA-binding response OmpR family regulator